MFFFRYDKYFFLGLAILLSIMLCIKMYRSSIPHTTEQRCEDSSPIERMEEPAMPDNILDLQNVQDERINRIPSLKNSGIPKSLWQTYISKQLPSSVRRYQQSWLTNLPNDYRYNLFDDQDISDYIHSPRVKNEFPGIVECWNLLPIGVMKADLWRYCILYFEGGIYTDIDTILIQPKFFEKIATSNARMIVGLETENPESQCFCQWTILSEAGHPILKTCISLIIQRSKNGIDTQRAHFVHEFTGPTIWTHAINLSFGLPMGYTSIQTTNYLKQFPEKNDLGLQIVRSNFLTYEYVQHKFNSITSNDPEYHRWKDDVFYE